MSDACTPPAATATTTVELPQKRCYRQRAHCNPWSDHTLDYPVKPDDMDWTNFYTINLDDNAVRFVDVGCGYGGLLFKLATEFPDIRSLGMEIRLKVCDFVQEKIRALRRINPGQYANIACLRTNAMKFLPNFFHKAQLHKMFFLYPDPHFKRVKYKWRIISPNLLDLYAYLLTPGGLLYATTDVPDLANWMVDCFSQHRLFDIRCCVHLQPRPDGKSLDLSDDLTLNVVSTARVNTKAALDRAIKEDTVVKLLVQGCTDEAAKATREGRSTSVFVFERLPTPPF